jgi:hypothetical protein
MDKLEYKATEAALKKYGGEIIMKMTKILNDKKKSSSGNLIDTFESEVEEEDGLLYLDIIMAHYAEYVDKGRDGVGKGNKIKKGSRPPFDAIEKWVKQKPYTLKRNQSIRSATFAVMNKIAIYGIDPVPFLHLVGDMIGDLNEDIADGVIVDMEGHINGLIKDFNDSQK